MPFSRILCAVFVLIAGLQIGCGGPEDDRKDEARDVAKQFHKDVLTGDIDALMEIVDYPFRFDLGNEDIGDEAELKKLLQEKRATMRDRIRSANYTQVLTYEEFVSGKEFAGMSLERRQAEAQAKKIGLRPGGLIVRCYHKNEDGREDGREYYLVIHPNLIGDLKVTSYHD